MTPADTNIGDAYNDKLTFGWIIGIAIILALVAGTFIDWSFALGPVIVLAVYISIIKSPKALMCIAYHIILLLVTYWFTMTFLAQLVDFQWWTGFDWIRKFIRVIYQVVILYVFTKSIISCWDSTKLKETEIGQLSYFNWMPKFGSNVHNQFGGIFTGLPRFLVKIIPIDATTKAITHKSPIQIEKHGSKGEKFMVIFDFNFKSGVDDTLVWMMNKNTDQDLINIVIEALTEWVNNPTNKYTDTIQIKKDKDAIEKHLRTKLAKLSREMYGVSITHFNLVDIEDPEKVIEQQIADEAALRHQIATDEREMLDQKAANQQALDLLKTARKAGDQTMTFTDALEQVGIQRGNVKVEKFTGPKDKNVHHVNRI